jgi:hypothetical protein
MVWTPFCGRSRDRALMTLPALTRSQGAPKSVLAALAARLARSIVQTGPRDLTDARARSYDPAVLMMAAKTKIRIKTIGRETTSQKASMPGRGCGVNPILPLIIVIIGPL